MGYTMKTEGLEEVSNLLKDLGDKADKIAAQGLYEGAGTMAEKVKRQAEKIRADKFHYVVFPGSMTRLPSIEEKEAVVQAGAGIAKFDRDGNEVQTSVGFSNAGYWEIAGKMKPVPLIANSINSGTSFMQRQPFFRKAVSSGTKDAQEAIIKKIESLVDDIIKQQSGGK